MNLRQLKQHTSAIHAPKAGSGDFKAASRHSYHGVGGRHLSISAANSAFLQGENHRAVSMLVQFCIALTEAQSVRALSRSLRKMLVSSDQRSTSSPARTTRRTRAPGPDTWAPFRFGLPTNQLCRGQRLHVEQNHHNGGGTRVSTPCCAPPKKNLIHNLRPACILNSWCCQVQFVDRDVHRHAGANFTAREAGCSLDC